MSESVIAGSANADSTGNSTGNSTIKSTRELELEEANAKLLKENEALVSRLQVVEADQQELKARYNDIQNQMAIILAAVQQNTLLQSTAPPVTTDPPGQPMGDPVSKPNTHPREEPQSAAPATPSSKSPQKKKNRSEQTPRSLVQEFNMEADAATGDVITGDPALN